MKRAEYIRDDILSRVAKAIRHARKGHRPLFCISVARKGWPYGNKAWRSLSGELLQSLRAASREGNTPSALYGAFRGFYDGTVCHVAAPIVASLDASDRIAEVKDVISHGVFFLCSSHTGCADGHRAYQGRMYVSRSWRSRVPCSSIPVIADFIAKNGLTTVESVIARPIYMCVRPNCRHRLRAVPIAKAMSEPVEDLLRGYGMLLKGLPLKTHSETMRDRYAAKARAAAILSDACGSPAEGDADVRRLGSLRDRWGRAV